MQTPEREVCEIRREIKTQTSTINDRHSPRSYGAGGARRGVRI